MSLGTFRVYATHMRDEARNVVESVKEAQVPLAISHHKICGRAFWGKSSETLKLIDEAAARGVEIMLDQYP